VIVKPGDLIAFNTFDDDLYEVRSGRVLAVVEVEGELIAIMPNTVEPNVGHWCHLRQIISINGKALA
jgi:hypothetical protein